eukprot:14734871-Ditylum_brightwellii.AAC.1
MSCNAPSQKSQEKSHEVRRKKKYCKPMADVIMRPMSETMRLIQGSIVDVMHNSKKSKGSYKSVLSRMPRGIPKNGG